jgi:hypothetical protein
VEIAEEVNAKSQAYRGDEAWQVIAEAERVYVASGKKIIEFEPATADKELMLKKITGPSGNLRAPAFRRGKVFYIGYSDELYDSLR